MIKPYGILGRICPLRALQAPDRAISYRIDNGFDHFKVTEVIVKEGMIPRHHGWAIRKTCGNEMKALAGDRRRQGASLVWPYSYAFGVDLHQWMAACRRQK
jgi:hypothetical protein